MTLPVLALFLAAALSLWLGRWNATCWALAFALLIVEAGYDLFGTLGADVLFMVDLMTVTLICAKTAARADECVYLSGWHQLRCFLMSPTKWDRLILAIFPLAVWPAYVLNLSDHSRWWLLWAAALAQFLIAFTEAIEARRSAKALDLPDTSESGPLAFAGSPRGYG